MTSKTLPSFFWYNLWVLLTLSGNDTTYVSTSSGRVLRGSGN